MSADSNGPQIHVYTQPLSNLLFFSSSTEYKIYTTMATGHTLLPQHSLMLNGLHSLYKERVLCDVTLQAYKRDITSPNGMQTVTVDAHKSVLAAGSPYFR